MTELIIHIILVLVAAAMAWQDFTTRTVHVGWLLALLAALSFRSYQHTGLLFHTSDLLTNLLFLGAQYIGLVLYFSFKLKKVTWVMDQQLGWGDLLFLLACALTFPTVQYIVFVLTGMIFTLLIVALLSLRNKSASSSVPLAGWLSLYLLLWIFMDPLNQIILP